MEIIMRITFLGATHEVTGSCTLIEACGSYILVDCGMEQGADIFENAELPVDASLIDCVLVTHAHIDHTGKIPLLYKNGFEGRIIATKATCALMDVMLRDSAHIQESDAEWKNRKSKRSGGTEYDPMYTVEDVNGMTKLLFGVDYGVSVEVLPGVKVVYRDMGHALGSAAITVEITENGETRTVVFSGDIGNTNRPLIRDPQKIRRADAVVMESTYGTKLHEATTDHVRRLVEIIQRTLDRGGNVVIPSFAVGRTQEILYYIRHIKADGMVKGHDGFPVYVDSPLGAEATEIFMECDVSYFDDETAALISNGINPISFDGLRMALTSEESKEINFDPTPKVIIASSGMCEAGRIRHHLKHNLWREESSVLFVGYQAEGTLGRIIYDGAKSVKLFGEEIAVKCEIALLAGVSGHADKNGLIDWIRGFEEKPDIVFVNHGEDSVCESFAATLKDEYGFNATAPFSGTSYDLLTLKPLEITFGVRVKKKAKEPSPYDMTVTAAKRLLDAVKKCAFMKRSVLAMYTSEINRITDKINDRLKSNKK